MRGLRSGSRGIIGSMKGGDPMADSTQREIGFSVFVLYRLAEHWGRPVPDVYQTLKRVDALEDYVIPFHDVLHTLGEEYLVEDLTEYVRLRGVEP